jgi:hypothetical protein
MKERGVDNKKGCKIKRCEGGIQECRKEERKEEREREMCIKGKEERERERERRKRKA